MLSLKIRNGRLVKLTVAVRYCVWLVKRFNCLVLLGFYILVQFIQ